MENFNMAKINNLATPGATPCPPLDPPMVSCMLLVHVTSLKRTLYNQIQDVLLFFFLEGKGSQIIVWGGCDHSSFN